MLDIKIRKCVVCGAEFRPLYGDAKIKYCSAKCVSLKNKQRREIKLSEAIKTGKIHGQTLQELIYNRYKATAKRKNREFNISLDVFSEFWQKNCHYCGDRLQSVGFDRVDSRRGYTIDNIVPCCTFCNLMKRHISQEDFISRCKRIALRSLL